MTERLTARPRIRSAVAYLRNLHKDGYDVALIAEIALGNTPPAPKRDPAEHAILRDLYREEAEGPAQPAGTSPDALTSTPVFADFVKLYPGAGSGNYDALAMEWRALTAAERNAAVSSIPAFVSVHRDLKNALPAAHEYLRWRHWKNLP